MPLLVIDVDSASQCYGKTVGRLDLPNIGDELHHFGWNACSAALCPYAPHPHLERRYLVVPGIRSSRIHIIDTKPDPKKLEIVKIIEPEDVFARTGYSRPHTVHCGPEGIYISALGAPDGSGPGGIFILDHLDFNVLGRWEVDRGPQELAYDFWWHLGHDVLISSEWGTPNKIENGLIRKTCFPAATATNSISGIFGDGSINKRLAWAKNSRWFWNCDHLMSRLGHLVLSELSSH